MVVKGQIIGMPDACLGLIIALLPGNHSTKAYVPPSEEGGDRSLIARVLLFLRHRDYMPACLEKLGTESDILEG